MAKRKRVTFGGSGKKVSFLIRMDEMDEVFKKAKEKAVNRISKVGNTATPWEDFKSEHLKKRLDDEIKEWHDTEDIKELLDIINMAIFVYLAEQRAKRGAGT